MRILFIHNKYLQHGGEDVVVDMETSILTEKGHEVRNVFFNNASISGFFSRIRAALNSVHSFSSARTVSKAIVQFKPDIIHIHNLFFIASPSVLSVANKHKVPVVFTLNNYRLVCCNSILLRNNKICELCLHQKVPFSGIRYKCYRNSSIESALVTAITSIHKLFGTWRKKVATYIALNEFSRSKFLNSSLRLTNEKIITKQNFVRDFGEGSMERENFFLFAGRIVKEKGVHVLAQAFAGMPENKVIIIGEGPDKELLEKMFSSNQNIIFKGRMQREEVSSYMKRCRAVICPSIWYEGTPLTVIEAFATGTPVIASGLGSMMESVSDGFNGLHFTAGDPDDLKNKVGVFINETSTNKIFYKNARQTYLEKYQPEVHYKAILKIYETAIAKQYNA